MKTNDLATLRYDWLAPKYDWLAAEMPPGYRNRLEEVQRLTRDLAEMERFGRLLYAVGDELSDAVLHAFVAIGFEAVATPAANALSIEVRLDAARRLLIHVSASAHAIERRDDDLAQVFNMLHARAGHGDRVVLVSNIDPATRPADRHEGVTADALDLLTRLGANHLPGPTLFAIWSRSHDNRELARAFVDRLHAQDGGVFLTPAAALGV